MPVHDKARVRLVDSEAERVGRYDNTSIACHESLLRELSLTFGHLPVVLLHRNSLTQEPFVNLIHSLHRGGIDKSAALFVVQEFEQRVFLFLAIDCAFGEQELYNAGAMRVYRDAGNFILGSMSWGSANSNVPRQLASNRVKKVTRMNQTSQARPMIRSV
jgi:hypothetical protein